MKKQHKGGLLKTYDFFYIEDLKKLWLIINYLM